MKFYLWDKTENLTESDREEIAKKEADLISRLEPKYNRNLKTSLEEKDKNLFKKLVNESEEAEEDYKEYKKEYSEYLENSEELEEPPF